jgi:amidase
MAIPFRSATELLAELQSKRLGCRELLEMYLSRIEKYDTEINAVVVPDFARARARADKADQALKRGESWGQLHGLPMTVKESISVAGLPTTRGVPELRNNIAERNMLAVDRLLDAGAVIFGKTNVPLMLSDWQSFNEIYGTTNNPWNPKRTPGGSSGGSAAALAAGLTGLEVGSDIAGSIRNPAHYCGVYGHKPTHGICPAIGHELGGKIAPRDITVIGPMGRSASDLELALGVLAGPDDIDGRGWRLELPQPHQRSLSDFRVAVMLDDRNAPVDDEIKQQIQNLAEFLARQGAIVKEARPDIDTDEAARVFTSLQRGASANRLSTSLFEERLQSLRELRNDDDSFAARFLRADTASHRDWLAANEARHKMRMKWKAFFTEWDVLLCPPACTTAILHDQTTERMAQTITVNGRQQSAMSQMFWAGYPALALLPSTVAPIGFSADQLPVGVQIVGPQYGDLICIRLASLIERNYHRFTRPPQYRL